MLSSFLWSQAPHSVRLSFYPNYFLLAWDGHQCISLGFTAQLSPIYTISAFCFINVTILTICTISLLFSSQKLTAALPYLGPLKSSSTTNSTGERNHPYWAWRDKEMHYPNLCVFIFQKRTKSWGSVLRCLLCGDKSEHPSWSLRKIRRPCLR